MEMKINPKDDSTCLESKQDTVNEMKEKFKKMIMNKLGDLLLDGISEFLGVDYNDQDRIKVVKFPQFLKPLFGYFKDSQLLIETSLLYIFHSLEFMSTEMQTRYDINLSKIEQKKGNLIEFKDLLWINLDQTLDFPCKFTVPAVLVPLYPYCEEEVQNLVTLALLKIFEWLGLLNYKVSVLIPAYQTSFTKIYHSLKEKLTASTL